MRAPQFFRTNAGHRAGKRPLAAPFIPQISFMQEVHFRRLIRSLSLRLYSLLAPRADQTKAARWPLRPPGLLLPGFQVAGSPLAPAEYDYDAKLRIAPTGLSPASTAASLAAPLLPDFHRLHWHQLAWRTVIPPFSATDPKWNKIEHRMFCHITENWRGRPLVSRKAVVNLIGNTTTKGGLEIQAELDEGSYPTGREVTEDQLARIAIERDKFHEEWNYTVSPRR